MNHPTSNRTRNLPAAALLAMALFAAISNAYAGLVGAPPNDEESLERGSIADITPPQKYQTAIREAGGAYKEALRDCAQPGDEERRACTDAVRTAYDLDMARAKLIFRGREIQQACVRG